MLRPRITSKTVPRKIADQNAEKQNHRGNDEMLTDQEALQYTNKRQRSDQRRNNVQRIP